MPPREHGFTPEGHVASYTPNCIMDGGCFVGKGMVQRGRTKETVTAQAPFSW